MLFSIGNIITILIVLIILAIYRQLDRNNRSLDKVRKYSDKVTSDIEGFVDQKTQDMKNLAIEIDVHQKAGKEVLKRISAIEEGFSDKAAEIDVINTRINEYDKAISELVGMTGKVDENLKRLHQESEFVDRVGKRLKDAQLRMAQLEKNIPKLTEDFSVINEKEIEKLRVEIFSEVERQSAVVLDGIAQGSERVDEFRAHLDELESKRDSAADNVMRTINENLESSVEKAEQKLGSLKEDFSVSLDAILTAKDEKKTALVHQLDSSETRFRGHVEEIGELLNNKLVSFKDSINSLEENYQKNLKDSAENARLLEDDVFAALKNYIEERSRDTRKQINNVFEELKKSSLTYRTEMDNSFGESQSEIKVWRAKLQKELDDGEADIQSRIDSLKPKTEKMLAEIEEKSRELVDSTKGDVLRRVDTMIENVNEKENRLSEFEESLAYKLTRIEEITSDIDLLESNLKQMVDNAVDEVNSGFDSIKEEMTGRWQRSSSEIDVDIQNNRDIMQQLESDLEALKARAYDNVSAKLKDFEDGFFDDIKEKSVLIDKQLEDWQQSVDSRLEQIAEDAVSERESLEKSYNDKFDQGVINMTERASEGFRRYEQHVDEYEGVLKNRLEDLDASVDSIKTQLDANVSAANSELRSFIQNELEKTREIVDADISRFVRNSEIELRKANEDVSAEREQIRQKIDAQTSELELWQARLNQQLADSENSITGQYSQMKSEAAERISEIRESMTGQREDFDNISSEIIRRSRDIQSQLDQQLKDYEEKSAEITENFSLTAKQMYEKIDEQSRELAYTINEIDTKQKNFISQTKIFERADSMKEALESGISDLQIEITRVTNEASEVHEAEKKFASIRKLAEEISSKMEGFAANKKRLEELDADFQRLMSISKSVETRLSQVTEADDGLQLVQAKLKALDDLQHEVESRYDRLQKKGEIVDSTINGVDRSFEQLNELEKMIGLVAEKSSPLTSRLDELARRIDFLSRNKKEIDTAVGHIETMDATLSDLEERIERMQKAREWLAGTETRLEEVNKQAQEQVKLLATLVKGSESKARSGGGAPPHELRDVVIKLARQGWTVEQIAKSTQLARGEVELILELQPKK